MSGGLKDLEELRTFVQVIDSRSMTAAAAILGVPTNVVSRRFARLEARLGVPLAQRTTRKLHATEEGRRLHQRAQRVLAEVEAAEAEIFGLDEALRGELRLSIPTLFSDYAQDGLRAMLREHPALQLRVFVTDAPASTIVRDLVERGLDAAVLVGALPDSSLVTRPLARLTLVLAASRAYVTARGKPRRVTDLSRHECLCFLGEGIQTEWPLVNRQGHESPVRVAGRFASSDSRTLRQAMLDGLGIGVVLPGELADNDALVPILEGYHLPPMDVRLGFMPARRASPRVQALTSVLAESLLAMASGGGLRCR